MPSVDLKELQAALDLIKKDSHSLKLDIEVNVNNGLTTLKATDDVSHGGRFMEITLSNNPQVPASVTRTQILGSKS